MAFYAMALRPVVALPAMTPFLGAVAAIHQPGLLGLAVMLLAACELTAEAATSRAAPAIEPVAESPSGRLANGSRLMDL